jgi:hypothetical protein
MKNRFSYFGLVLLILEASFFFTVYHVIFSMPNIPITITDPGIVWLKLYPLAEASYFPLFTISFICAIMALASVKRDPSIGGKKIAIFTLVIDSILMLTGISAAIFTTLALGRGI